MSKVVLQAKNRQKHGSAESRRIRRGGRIPAVIYGRSGNAVSIDMDAADFVKGTKGISESTIVKVEVDGKSYDAFVKGAQRNIIDGNILHIDFYEVESGVVLRAKVPLVLQGNSVGVREGGILENPTHEVEVECLPKDLPERIEVDISALQINHSLYVRDITLAEGVKLHSNPDQVVALVKFAKAEVVAPVETAATAEGATPAEGAAAGTAATPAAAGDKKGAPAAGDKKAAPGAGEKKA
ncbi:MAG: 50S ribosomal protein L25 [Treponema sp.]|jgi:large subunit ribosomal protein L25|nr:50S ribosomal protein L25 [Treponema sp.]